MSGVNISEGETYSYIDGGYNYEPPTTKIFLWHVEEIYRLCGNAQKQNIPRSEIILNMAAACFGGASIAGCFGMLSVVIVLAIMGSCFYFLYFLSRKEDVNTINNLANEIINLMPISIKDIEIAKRDARNVANARVQSYMKHLEDPYK